MPSDRRTNIDTSTSLDPNSTPKYHRVIRPRSAFPVRSNALGLSGGPRLVEKSRSTSAV